MRTNHRVTVEGSSVELFFEGYALNILHLPTGSNLWGVWKCSGMTFVVTHARGNEMARNYLPEQ